MASSAYGDVLSRLVSTGHIGLGDLAPNIPTSQQLHFSASADPGVSNGFNSGFGHGLGNISQPYNNEYLKYVQPQYTPATYNNNAHQNYTSPQPFIQLLQLQQAIRNHVSLPSHIQQHLAQPQQACELPVHQKAVQPPQSGVHEKGWNAPYHPAMSEAKQANGLRTSDANVLRQNDPECVSRNRSNGSINSELNASNVVAGAIRNTVLEHNRTPTRPDNLTQGRPLRGSGDMCTPQKLEQCQLSTSTPSQAPIGSKRPSPAFRYTDTSGFSSDGSSENEPMLIRDLDVANPLAKQDKYLKQFNGGNALSPHCQRRMYCSQEVADCADMMDRSSLRSDFRRDPAKYQSSFLSSPPNETSLVCHSSLSPGMDAFQSTGSGEVMVTSSSSGSPGNDIDAIAKLHRHAAASHDATCTWSGVLPPRNPKNPNYSCKVFLGGVPWDITAAGLQSAFRTFGHVRIEFPGTGNTNAPRYPRNAYNRVRTLATPDSGNQLCCGYVYAIFDSDRQVKAMLQQCTRDYRANGEYYFKISSRRMKCKEVQVIPWVLSDSNYVVHNQKQMDNETTIFVGALHGMLNAEGLAKVMNDLFGNVIYAGVDTDKYKYPIGSGRVTFSSHKSYMKAVNAAFVEIKTSKFVKKVQIDPYLEENLCSFCKMVMGPYFCRNQQCFKYYCQKCWNCQHNRMDPSTGLHKPLTRNSKNGNGSAATVRQLPEIKAVQLKPDQPYGDDQLVAFSPAHSEP